MSISVVGKVAGAASGTNSTTFACPFTGSVPAGDLVVVTLNIDSSGNTLQQVTDTQGNTYQVDVGSNSPGSNALVASSVLAHAVTAADTFTPKLASASAQWAVQAVDVSSTSGWDPANYLDAGSVTVLNQSGTALSITGTTVRKVAIVWGVFGYKHGVTPVLTFTLGAESTASFVQNKSSGQFDSIAAEYAIESTVGSKTRTGTLSAASADTCAAALLSYFDNDPANLPIVLQAPLAVATATGIVPAREIMTAHPPLAQAVATGFPASTRLGPPTVAGVTPPWRPYYEGVNGIGFAQD